MTTIATYAWNNTPREEGRWGDRQIARGSDGYTWVCFQHRITGANWVLRCLRIAPSYLGALVEDVATGLPNELTAMALCVDANDEPVIIVRQKASTTTKVFRRESGTWTAKATYTTNHTGGRSVSIACDSAGVFYTLYGNDRTTIQSIFLRTSTDDLATWNATVAAESYTPSSDTAHVDERRAVLAIDRSDIVHCAWVIATIGGAPRLRYNTYNAGFGTPETLDTPIGGTNYEAKDLQLALDSNDVPHLVLTRQHPSSPAGVRGVVYTNRVGGTWSAFEAVHSAVRTSQEMPTIMLEADDTVHICWVGEMTGVGTNPTRMFEAEGVAGGPWTVVALSENVATTDQQNPHLVHSLSPGIWGHSNAGFLVNWFSMLSGSSEGRGRYGVASGTVWHGEPSATLDLTLGVTASTGGNLYPKSITWPLHLSISPDHNTEMVRAAVTGLSLQITALWPGHAYLPLTLGVSVDPTLIAERAAAIGLTLDVSAVRTLPLLCETDYVPSPPIQSNIDAVLKVKLIGPYDAPTTQVQLMRPVFPDTRDLDPQTTVHATRHGEPHAWRRSTTYRRLAMDFENLERAKVLEVEAFLKTVRGRSVRFIDWELRVWKARILSPTMDAAQELREHGGTLHLELDVEAVT